MRSRMRRPLLASLACAVVALLLASPTPARTPKSVQPPKRVADSPSVAAAKASLRTKQFGAALEELRAAAEHGDVQSQYLLGLVYASGVAPEMSLTEARRWLEAAADKSNADATLALSSVLVEQDRAAAQQWLTRAASEGQPIAVKLVAAHSLPL